MASSEDREVQRLSKAGKLSKKELAEELCGAASKGWTKVVTHLLEMGASPNAGVDGTPALAHAARFGADHVEAAQLLLDKGADPNGCNVMTYCGVESFPVLVEAGGRVNGNRGETHPLHVAIAERTKQDKALLLIAAGADINAADEDGSTPLMLAAEKGRTKVFDALVKAGADLYAVDQTGRSILRRAVEKVALGWITDSANALTIVRKLRKLLPSQPEDLLLIDLTLGDVESLRQQLESGLDPNTGITGSISLLTISFETFSGHLKNAGGLIDGLANGSLIPSASEADNATEQSSLLMWAVAMKQPDLVELLLKHGADPNWQNRDGISAAIMSATSSDLRIRQILGTLSGQGRRVPRGTKIKPATDDWAQEGSLAKRLGIVTKSETQMAKQDDELCSNIRREAEAGTFLDCWVETAWEQVSRLHALERPADLDTAMDFTLSLCHEHFFGKWRSKTAPNEDTLPPYEPIWRQLFPWVNPFVLGCATAAARGQWDDVAKLSTYPGLDCSKETPGYAYAHDYVDWNFWMPFALRMRNEAVDEKPFRETIERGKGKRAKLMLEVHDQILSGDTKSCLKSFGKLMTWHRNFVIGRFDTLQGSDVVSAEATLLWAWAKRCGLKITPDNIWSDFVLRCR